MEPERNIEKELKAYAQQRRADAGTPPELHPAIRKLLQDEAARSAKRVPADTRSWRQSLWGSWPRLAVTGLAAVAAVVMCRVLFPGPSHNKIGNIHPAMEMARNREALQEQPASQAKAGYQEKEAAIRRMSPRTKAAPSVLEDRTVLHMHMNTAAAPPLAAPPPASLPAASPPGAFTATAKDSPSFGAIGGTTSFASTDKSSSLNSADNPVTPVILPFRRTDLQQNTDSSAVGSAEPNVLISFRVEQTLDNLRMIDSDGSIYQGFVARTPESAKRPADVVEKLVAEDSLKPAVADGKQTQPMRLYRFRVSGTNRTLQQEVVFTGNFFTAADSPAVSGGESVVTNAPAGSVGGQAGSFTSPLDLQKVRLVGRLLLGKTNKIEINALPVKP